MSATARRVSAVIIMAFLLVFALFVPPAFASFKDTKTHWADDAIEALVARDVIGGYPDNTFRPEQPITRAEFAKMTATALEIESEASSGFADTQGHWAEESIDSLAAEGIVEGYPDASFRPDTPITRAEAAMILARALDVVDVEWFADSTDPTFSDVAAEHWAYPAVEAVGELGIVPAFVQGEFDPDAALTRAEAAWMVHQSTRLNVESGQVTFADAPSSRMTIETASGRIRDFLIERDTVIARGDAVDSLDSLSAGDSVYVVADRFGTPRLVVADPKGTGADLTQQLARTVLEVFTTEELQQLVAGDWSVASAALLREANERLQEAGITESEAQAVLTRDWDTVKTAAKDRLQQELAEELSISPELSQALVNRDWNAAKEQAQLEVAQHLLNRLLSTLDTPAQDAA